MNSSLEVSDQQAAAVQVTPHRVTLDQVNAAVDTVEYLNPESAAHFTVAIVKLRNGFIVTGESAPADPANFNKDLGQALALETAKRKIWPLLGFSLCEKLSVKPDETNTAAAA